MARGRRPGTALRELNALIGDAMGRLVLSDSFRWEWREAGDRLDAMLWPVIRSAAELLASSALQQRYAALVQLYKALGGGWQ